MQGVWVFASAAARDAAVTSPQEGNFAYLKDTNVTTYYTGSAWANLDTTGMTNPMTTTGDIIYSSSGSTPARLGIGSTGNVLTVSGGVPAWSAPAGGGKVLQVVQATSSTATTVASTTMTDSGLSVTITPSLSSSKVLILVSQGLLLARNSDRALGGWRLMRGATEILNGNDGFFILANLGGAAYQTSMQAYFALNYLDTPSTTSATTYKTQIKVNTTADSAKIHGQGENGVTSSIIALEIGA
jgi:hypothetical protein